MAAAAAALAPGIGRKPRLPDACGNRFSAAGDAACRNRGF